ncbi:glutathione S-transferase-like protein [Gautieria morchelliformis]|nr:glutathione S-transferase-like protein [Gautieria morchelliformis]
MSQNPLLLYTARTPNGTKPSILLEELKAAYGLDYDYQALALSKKEQKEEWYIKINPNGRIPALVDRSRNNFPVFESSAVLLYLIHHYDKDHKFCSQNADQQSEILQWIFFADGGISPNMGQASHFMNAPEKIPYAIDRYLTEAKRLFGVLEIRLKDHDYLVGPGRGTYTIADISSFTWVRLHKSLDIDMEEFPGIQAWLDRIEARPAVQAGLMVPPPA